MNRSRRIWSMIAWLLTGTVSACLGADSAPQIRSVVADGKPVAIEGIKTSKLPTRTETVTFGFDGPADSTLLRVRYRLDGFDEKWRESRWDGVMTFTVRFSNSKGDTVGEKAFTTTGQSEGWTGVLGTSRFKHRRELLDVPAGAANVWVVMSSAGPPSVVGVWAITNIVVAAVPPGDARELLHLTFPPETSDERLEGWMADGTHASMAKVSRLDGDSKFKALVIVDDDPRAHAEWHTIRGQGPAVVAGEHLVLEWDEAYSISAAGFFQVSYTNLPSGFYRFQINGLTVMGMPTEAEASIAVEVPVPMWRTPWYWVMILAMATSATAGIYRYIAWRQMRRDLARMESQRALERERVRIAQDIHDDLGARVTQISLVSGLARADKDLSEKARADFDSISRLARELVSALYETVWAVNPENDNLDAVGNYICQTVDNLCEQAQLRRRLKVADLPREGLVSSQVRHNLAMAVKEAVHNVIKHAHASEVCVQVDLEDATLVILVSDDGCGFDPARRSSGNGLINMKDRLSRIGGSSTIRSAPGRGTTVEFRLKAAPRAH